MKTLRWRKSGSCRHFLKLSMHRRGSDVGKHTCTNISLDEGCVPFPSLPGIGGCDRLQERGTHPSQYPWHNKLRVLNKALVGLDIYSEIFAE